MAEGHSGQHGKSGGRMKKSEFKETFCKKCPIADECEKFEGCHAYNLCGEDDLVTPTNAIINKMLDLDKAVKAAPFCVLEASVYGKMTIRVEHPETVEEIAKAYGVHLEQNSMEALCEVANVIIYSDRR